MSNLLVLAQIGARQCAFATEDVQSVIEIGSITPIPCSPDFVVGLTALRSQALTVLDCRKAIGCIDKMSEPDHRALVVHLDGHAYALLVDRVDDVATARGNAEQIPGGFGEEWQRISRGMIETDRGPVLLIKLDALISGFQPSRAAA